MQPETLNEVQNLLKTELINKIMQTSKLCFNFLQFFNGRESRLKKVQILNLNLFLGVQMKESICETYFSSITTCNKYSHKEGKTKK
jgi:hypothetical protein